MPITFTILTKYISDIRPSSNPRGHPRTVLLASQDPAMLEHPRQTDFPGRLCGSWLIFSRGVGVASEAKENLASESAAAKGQPRIARPHTKVQLPVRMPGQVRPINIRKLQQPIRKPSSRSSPRLQIPLPAWRHLPIGRNGPP
jgi:hypothetical protein